MSQPTDRGCCGSDCFTPIQVSTLRGEKLTTRMCLCTKSPELEAELDDALGQGEAAREAVSRIADTAMARRSWSTGDRALLMLVLILLTRTAAAVEFPDPTSDIHSRKPGGLCNNRACTTDVLEVGRPFELPLKIRVCADVNAAFNVTVTYSNGKANSDEGIRKTQSSTWTCGKIESSHGPGWKDLQLAAVPDMAATTTICSYTPGAYGTTGDTSGGRKYLWVYTAQTVPGSSAICCISTHDTSQEIWTHSQGLNASAYAEVTSPLGDRPKLTNVDPQCGPASPFRRFPDTGISIELVQGYSGWMQPYQLDWVTQPLPSWRSWPCGGNRPTSFMSGVDHQCTHTSARRRLLTLYQFEMRFPTGQPLSMMFVNTNPAGYGIELSGPGCDVQYDGIGNTVTVTFTTPNAVLRFLTLDPSGWMEFDMVITGSLVTSTDLALRGSAGTRPHIYPNGRLVSTPVYDQNGEDWTQTKTGLGFPSLVRAGDMSAMVVHRLQGWQHGT
jgi:hypothetical protein